MTTVAPQEQQRQYSKIVKISDIKIGNRFRKDLGDVQSLAKNISEIGLLHPIVINPNNELICGVRRISAYELLGSSEIPVNVVNLDDVRRGEYSENTQRKDFSWHEIIELKKALEPEIKKESEKRMLSGKPSAKFAEGSTNSSNNIISLNPSENQTRAKVAKYVSFHGNKVSHATLTKAEAVYDAAQKQPNIVRHIWSDLNNEKISPHKAYRRMRNLQRRQEILAEKPGIVLPRGVNLIEGDFIEKCKDIADSSIHLIFTDPLYAKEFLPVYDELAKVAARVLKDGGSIVTYCGQDSKLEVIDFMKSRGLTYWWEIAILHAGSFARVYPRQVVVTWKPLLWFVKGSKLRTSEFVRDSIQSQLPDKAAHDYAQSSKEAEHIISRLTIQNDIILDPLMGSGTTGIAALTLNRKFIGIERDEESFRRAQTRIAKLTPQTVS